MRLSILYSDECTQPDFSSEKEKKSWEKRRLGTYLCTYFAVSAESGRRFAGQCAWKVQLLRCELTGRCSFQMSNARGRLFVLACEVYSFHFIG